MIIVHTYMDLLYTVVIANINSGNVLLFHYQFLICKAQWLQITPGLFASFTTNKPPKTWVNMSILFITAAYFWFSIFETLDLLIAVFAQSNIPLS